MIGIDGRDDVRAALARDGIESQIGTYAVHRLSAYAGRGSFPGADRAFERALALPFATTTTRGRGRPGLRCSPREHRGLDKMISCELSITSMLAMSMRLTADERRESVLVAAAAAFARSGLHGASTEDIASSAGISQPYLFRLFGTKKRLFLASVERCFESTLEVFRNASEGLQGEDAFRAMGKAYVGWCAATGIA